MDIAEWEKIVLAGLINKPDRLVDCQLKGDDFSDTTCRECYEAINRLWRDKAPVDIAIVAAEMVMTKENTAFVVSLTDVLVADFSWAVKQVSEAAKCRRIKTGMQRLADDQEAGVLGDAGGMLDGLMNIYQSELFRLRKDADISSHLERFTAAQKRNKEGYGHSTGFEFLDDAFIQYAPGHVWTIGAYTSVGKTATAIEMVCRAIDKRIVVISTEMTAEQNIGRILANQTGINSNVILSGNMFDQHKELVGDAQAQLGKQALTIYDDVFELQDIEAVVRKADLQGGVDIVVIDYLQNISVSGAKSEYEAMNRVAKTIQRLAKQVNATIVCLSQIPNHAAREDTGIIEFKGAGEIAAVSDVGIWLKRAKDDKGKILFDVRKNRHGALTKAVMAYQNGWTSLTVTEEDTE